MRTAVLSATLAATLAAPAAAGDLTVDVRDLAGAPVKDAVVLVHTAAGGPARAAQPLVMTQENIAFAPYVLIVPLGATVSFPNKDKVRHHVYSFSKAKRFELKLYGRDETRTVTFDKPGPVPLGCNIHDQMIAFIYVADTPYAVRTGADGSATLRGVPAGAAKLTVWHPDLKNRTPPLRTLAVSPAAQRQSTTLDLRAVGGR